MSTVKEVAKINGYPVKDKIAREKLEKPQLADFVDCDIFAQVIGEKVGFDMTAFGVQSLAIGDGIVCVGITSNNDTAGVHSKLIAYNINTGSVVAYADDQSIGHCNGMTYCEKDGCFYIACGGGGNGLNKIEVYNKSLVNVKTIDFSSHVYKNPYGVEWHEKSQSFYCCVSGRTLGKYDYDFNVIEYYETAPQTDPDTVHQTIFATDDYLFYITNNLAHKRGNYNKIDVYNINTMQIYKKQYVMHGLELEDCAVYNGDLYMLFNSQNAGLICKGSLYNDEYTGNFLTKYMSGGSRIATSSYDDAYYIDSTYMDFFVDNTQERPYNKLLLCIGTAIRSTYKERIVFYVKGDFSTVPINIKHLPCSLMVEGYGESKPKIGGVFLQSVGVATLRNIEIVTKSPPQDALLTLKSVGFAYIDGVDFNGTGTENDGIFMVSSTAQILKSNFISNVKRNQIHCNLNSLIFCNEDNTFIGSGGYGLPEYSAMPVTLDYKNFTKNLVNVTQIPTTTDFDITKIRRTGKYYLTGGSTSINCPDALKSGGYVFTVTYLNTVVIYDVIKYDTTRYKGIYSVNENKIRWLGDFYVSVTGVFESYCHPNSLLLATTTDLKLVNIYGRVFFSLPVTKDSPVATLNNNLYIKGRNYDYYFHGISESTGKGYIFRLKNNILYAHGDIPAGENIDIIGQYNVEDIIFNPS